MSAAETAPAFLRKLDRTREGDHGIWFTGCPDVHSSSGFSVAIWLDERMGRYRFNCVESDRGDLCEHERDLLRMLGLNEADVARELRDAAPAGESEKLTWQTLEEVDMRSIVFVDKPLLQASAFHLVAGRKGQGKGTLLAEIAARVTRGELGAKRNVVWIGSEDSASIDIKPRIVAAAGEPARVLIPKDGPWIQLPRDYNAIRQAMTNFGDVGMLVVDPVGNHISGKNSDGDTDIRDAIGPLNPIADEYECMAFGVRHLSEKDCSKGVLAAILGASAWVHVPRAVIAVARDNEDADVSHVQCVAGNRLPAGTPGRMFRIEGVLLPGLENEVTRAIWLGDSSKDVETMLGNSNGKEPSKSAIARELILDILEGEGEQESDGFDARIASETSISAKTARNLRGTLKNQGLIKAAPVKDEHGAITHWIVSRTHAPRDKQPAPAATASQPEPVPDSGGDQREI